MSRAPSGDAASPHIFLVAGEESGDRLGAALIDALRQRTQGRVRLSGVGGARMAEQGVPSLFPLGELAIMGFGGIVGGLPKILSRIARTADAIVAGRPDALVIIDSPDFTHRVARRVRAGNASIPIVDYVCPSVWAWRPGRARAMRGYVDLVLALLPFEPAAMQRLGGPPCEYVGHPLSERVGELRPNADEARRRLESPPLLLVMPGSRSGEIRRMAKVFGETAALLNERLGKLDVVVPAVPRLAETVKDAVASWRVRARVIVEQAEKDASFRAARAALTKSGTSTLELAVAGVPMVAGYRMSLFEETISHVLIKLDSVILANLVLGENVVPEFLRHDMEPQRLAAALTLLLSDTPERRRQIEAFRRLDAIMEIGHTNPSERAARLVLKCAAGDNQPSRDTTAPRPTTA